MVANRYKKGDSMSEQVYELYIYFEQAEKPMKLLARRLDPGMLDTLTEGQDQRVDDQQGSRPERVSEAAQRLVRFSYEDLSGTTVPVYLAPDAIRGVVPIARELSQPGPRHGAGQGRSYDGPAQAGSDDPKGGHDGVSYGQNGEWSESRDQTMPPIAHRNLPSRQLFPDEASRRWAEVETKKVYERGCEEGLVEANRRYHRWLRQEWRNRHRKLEEQILLFLSRFGEATVEQLTNPYPIDNYFQDARGTSQEIESFFASVDGAHERLAAMELDGLVYAVRDSGQGSPRVRYRATERGMERAGFESATVYADGSRAPMLAQGHEHALRMVDICQSVMETVGEKAMWVTNLELVDSGMRSRLKKKLGRKLPEAQSVGPKHVDPPKPDGILVLEESDILWAVILDPTRFQNKRPQALEDLMSRLYEERAVDRVSILMHHPEARERAKKLLDAFPDDGFFSFPDYQLGDPLGLRELGNGESVQTSQGAPGS